MRWFLMLGRRFLVPAAKSSILWSVISGVGLSALLYTGYQHYKAHKTLKSNYELAIQERDAANQQVADLIKQHEAQVARLEADRLEANNLRKQYRKDAQIENSKLKKLLAEKSATNDWYNSVLPDDIKRLREQRKTATAQFSPQNNTPGAN